MVGGRGVRLAPESQVREAELFTCVEVAGEQDGEALVRQASAVETSWLETREVVELRFDRERERVQAVRRTTHHDLVLAEHSARLPDDGRVEAVLLEEAATALDRALGLDRDPLRDLGVRLRFVRAHRPELLLPDWSEETLQEALPRLVPGCRSFADLRARAASDLPAELSWAQREALDREAPERLLVPSGSRIRLDYPDDGGAPVLAVRIQELFGLHDTPRVAGVPVVLHLLAPNMRAQQVTTDLAGFWARTWPQVRKELRGRYPKHAWPEDPLTAAPTRRTSRRR